MSGLNELRQRVEAAESHFGTITAQSETYSARLTGLMSRMEQAHSDRLGEVAALTAKVERAESENRELKGMLLGLLQAIETGDGSGVGHAVRDLERQIDTMVGDGQTGPADDSDASAAALEIGALREGDEAPADTSPAPDDAEVPVAESDGADDPHDADLLETAADDPIAVHTTADVEDLDADPSDLGTDKIASDSADLDSGGVSAEAADPEDLGDNSAAAGAEEIPNEFADMAEADVFAEQADTEDLAAGLPDTGDGEPDCVADPLDEVTDDAAVDPVDVGQAASDAGALSPKQSPVPETVALDDTDTEASRSGPANELLSRVDAVASALLEAGLDIDADDEELTGEISALLQDAIGARRARAAGDSDGASADGGEAESGDVAIEGWGDDGTADPGSEEIMFEPGAAA